MCAMIGALFAKLCNMNTEMTLIDGYDLDASRCSGNKDA